MLWHSEVIADFVKSIFSLIQEGGHFLAKTEVSPLLCFLGFAPFQRDPGSQLSVTYMDVFSGM